MILPEENCISDLQNLTRFGIWPEKSGNSKNRILLLHYHITSGDTEQVTEKLDKGLLILLFSQKSRTLQNTTVSVSQSLIHGDL